jgi:cellulose synthase/poly-beta-1,6-N-acetylglucosamine synthase-like glycosyltransferase
MTLSSAFEDLILFYALGSTFYTAIMCFGLVSWRRRDDCKFVGAPPAASIVIPAYNTSPYHRYILNTADQGRRAGLATTIVDDGSISSEANTLSELDGGGKLAIRRHPRNLGKAAALMTGVTSTSGEVVVTVDADTTLDAASIARCLTGFADPSVGAIAVPLRVAEAGWLAQCQQAEYRYVFDFERTALSSFGLVFTVPGAASFWRRTALNQLGGFSNRTMCEDTDATVGLGSLGWLCQVQLHSEAITVAPPTLRALIKQRRRWIWGNIQVSLLQSWRSQRGAITRLPSRVFALTMFWSIFGYVMFLWGSAMFLAGFHSMLSLTTTLALILLGALRAGFAMTVNGDNLRKLPETILSMIVMQFVNTVAFWYGFSTRSFLIRSWH